MKYFTGVLLLHVCDADVSDPPGGDHVCLLRHHHHCHCQVGFIVLQKQIVHRSCYRRSRVSQESLRCSNNRVIGKARIKTVKMSVILLVGFILCWTPYYFMSFWWWMDKQAAEQMDFRIQKLLWAFACLNNCLNPLFYKMIEPSGVK